jgi:hypothetical protein
MPNYGYHLARAEGNATRTIYRALLPSIARRRITGGSEVPVDVFAYCGECSLPEQVASIRSFLRYVGRPKQFTVVSDGTLSHHDNEILESIDPMISVSQYSQWLPKDLPERIYSYLTADPMGKQLALLMSLPVEGPTLYIDSDVLFFPGAKDFISLEETGGAPAFYLADCQLSADERLFRSDDKTSQPVNAGVLLFLRKLDWSFAVRRFMEMEGVPNFFTGQSMTHLTMHANEALPLDPRKCLLRLDDQFVYPDHYASPGLALRHYVNPVRHKFWTTMARQARW